MKSGSQAFIAIDQGSHATRAAAYDESGRHLAIARVNVDSHRPAPGRVEHDGERLVIGVRAALDDLAAQLPGMAWRAAGLAVQRSTVACWDSRSGALLAPVISWQDRRQAGWLERLAGHAVSIHEITGLPLSPHYGASKLRWFLDHVDAVREAAAEGRLRLGPLASLLTCRLLEGQPFVCDESNASRTQLWSPHDRRWSQELLELFGVPGQCLPRLSPTGATFGPLRMGQAQVPLTACTGDQAAVPWASGPLDPSTAYVNLGTGAFLLRPVAESCRAAPLLTSVLWSTTDSVLFALEGTVNGAGGAVEWFAREEGLPAERMLATLERVATPGLDAAYFLNGVSGIGSPFWVPLFDSRYVGDGDALGRLRAVVESIAFLLQANLDAMSTHAGAPRRLVVSGGLAGCGLLMRMIASLSGATVLRIQEAEATARGIAFLAAGQPDGWSAPETRRFDPSHDPPLGARYARWRELLRVALGD